MVSHQHHRRTTTTSTDNSVEDDSHVPRIPATLPDLRFEHTYLKSVSPFIKVLGRSEDMSTDSDYETIPSHHPPSISTPKPPPSLLPRPSEKINVQWGRIIYVTARDQVLMPLLQGAVWALLSAYLTPFAKTIFLSLKGDSSRPARTIYVPRQQQEGSGVSWLRRALESLRLRPSRSS